MLNRGLGLGLLLVLCTGPSVFGLSAAFAADRVTGNAQNGYRRLDFALDGAAKVTASTTGGVLTISFDRKPTLDPAAIAAAAPGLISSGRADTDGLTLRFALTQPVKLHVSQQGARAVVDLAPTNFNGVMPDLPPPPKAAPPKPLDVAALGEIRLRAGSYSNFTRLVFDWTKQTPYSVFPGAGKITVRFDTPMKMDLSVLAKMPPAWIKNAAWRLDGNTTLVELTTDPDAGYHHFRDGTKIVLDVLAPKTDTAAYVPPGTNKPSGVTKLASGAANGASAAQAKAIAETAAALAPKKPEEKKPADAKAAAAKPVEPAKPEEKNATATPAAAAPAPLPSASGQRTAGGASLTFRNANAAAVFIRGMTAWVVIPGSPAPDIAALQKALGDYAQTIENASSNGLSVLRITLKAQTKIAARADGPNLRVTLGPDMASEAVTIGFARNQSDPRRTSLTASLPRARMAVTLTDPASGDALTVVPSAAGYAMPGTRVFADFAALPSAQGLVIAPYADDLNVTVTEARVTIARPGGMALTPPQMPVASSPAALANATGGPSYLDLARWGQFTGGSFLATQRALNQQLATATPQQRNAARLKQARFYLAQGFGPEALGLINLVQAADPALKGDIQLSTMRAAAAVQMGRWRDARNELAGPLFESDRNASLWRGLAEAGMGNWREAHRLLEAADAVMARYPVEWQARAALARTEAALEMNRLDLTVAAISRLPKALPAAMADDARLVKARLAAGEDRMDDAMPEFVALEKSRDERLSAKAAYYRVAAALKSGTMSRKQAIEALEKLRFRWRGDHLELKTLRDLAALYFKENNWQSGLKTLRIATQNFNGDAARTAHDDMRAAFVNLYIKGGADKLPPITALAMFSDNMDLTPLGPDGDEMIRRIADRLVAVDLLQPASDLLAYQVEKRLEGVARAQVATRLASVQLMNHKPQDAITALRDSQITGLPQDIVHARMILEARAFAALKQYDNALDMIGVDESPDTRQLRADIYWESGNWAVAGQKLEELLAPALATPSPLPEAERMLALRAAVAYSLASDEKSLERLRGAVSGKIKGTPEGSLFTVLSEPIEMHGLAFREAAAKIAGVDTLRGFMQNFQKKFAGKNS